MAIEPKKSVPEGVRFEIHVRGNVTRKTWDGEFYAKPILSFAEQIRADRIKRDLLGAGDHANVNPEVMAQTIVLSELQVRLTDAPEWWKGGYGHADENLIQAVYDAAIKVRDDHFAKLDEEGEKATEELRQTRGPGRK